jgi:hypothetical protein
MDQLIMMIVAFFCLVVVITVLVKTLDGYGNKK